MAETGIEQMTQQAREMVTSLGRKRLIGFALIFLGIVGGLVGMAYWVNQPTWALLATDVDPESMNGVVERLKALKVKFQLDPGGRSVRVDETRVDELRMQLAAEGLPASGRIGFELFDRTMFGATELTEKVNYQRALEGELARTIAALGAVSGARVHLALPRTSLFANEAEPAKASVVLRLRTGRTLSAPEVEGVVALVSSSVEGLSVDGVTVIDSTGRRLSRQMDPAETGVDRGRFERQQQLERDMAARVVALLEPVVGIGRVRANVTASLKADSEDELEERWDPTSVVRSRQQTIEADGRPVASGAAGARANLPQGAPGSPEAERPAPSVLTSTNNRSSEVTNYEVSKLTRHRVSPAGQLHRLSVAVLVDDARKSVKQDDGREATVSTPRSAEELQRLQALVASAVGLVPSRGDQLTVENIAFDLPEQDLLPARPAPVPTWQVMFDQVRRNWQVFSGLAATLVVLVLGVMAFRRLRRTPRIALPVGGAAGPRLATAGGAPLAAATASHGGSAGRHQASEEPDPALPPSPSRQLAKLAQSEPEQLARIVRGWLAEEER